MQRTLACSVLSWMLACCGVVETREAIGVDVVDDHTTRPPLEPRPALPEPELSPGPELTAFRGIANSVLAVGRPNDVEAAQIVFEVLGAPTDEIPVVTWLDGLSCPDRAPSWADWIIYDGRCIHGVSFLDRSWCEPYVVWWDGTDKVTESVFMHELAHCAAVLLGFEGGDRQHQSWIWEELGTVGAALLDAGL